MNNIERVTELVEAELVRVTEHHKSSVPHNFNKFSTVEVEEHIAERIRLSTERSIAVQASYENRDSIVSWAEEILGQLGFTLVNVDRYGVYHERPKGVHTSKIVVWLNYGSGSLHGYGATSSANREPNFHVSTDKTQRHYAIKNGFAKQIARRIEDQTRIEEHFAGLKSGAYLEQTQVKAAFEKAIQGSQVGQSEAILNSEMVDDRHVFSMDFAGREVALHYLSNDYNGFDKGSIVVQIDFSAGGSGDSRIIRKTMLLEEFVESELVHLIYLDGALA